MLFLTLALLAAEPPFGPDAKRALVYAPATAEGATLGEPTFHAKSGTLYFAHTHAKGRSLVRLHADGKASPGAESWRRRGVVFSRAGELLTWDTDVGRMEASGVGERGFVGKKSLLRDRELTLHSRLAEGPDGTIYFSASHAEEAAAGKEIYRLDAGKAVKVACNASEPVGLAVSPDGRTLVVADAADACWKSYALTENGPLGPGKVFFNPPSLDHSGLGDVAFDEKGNAYLAGRGGVWVVSPEGKMLGLVPGEVTGLCFGGKDGRTLYVTSRAAVHTVVMRNKGVAFGKR